jgi:hypothetical protein
MSLTIVLPILGCGRSTPPSPASEEIWTVRHEEDHSLVKEVLIRLNGNPLCGAVVSIPAGREVHVTGNITLDPTRISKGGHQGAILVRLMPADSDDGDWEAVGKSFKFSDQFVGGANTTLDYRSPVKAGPGHYDARVYSVISDVRDGMPHHHLLCRGKVTITP